MEAMLCYLRIRCEQQMIEVNHRPRAEVAATGVTFERVIIYAGAKAADVGRTFR